MVQPEAMVQPQATVFRIGEFRVDPALDEISKEGTTTKLEPRTMRLLVCLAERAGQVVSVEQLLDLVWKDVVVSPDSVYQAVASLRRILGDDPKAPKYIANVMRRGYRLIAAVLPGTETAPPSARTAPRARGNNPRMATVALACIVVLGGSFAAWRELHGTERDAGGRSLGRQSIATPEVPSIAVLPFDESTTESYDGDLAQALAETVRQRLGLSEKITVKARGSSIAFAGQQADAKTIGQRLGVHYLLQGSVEREKTRLRVMAQLIDAKTGTELQSLSVDRQIADIFALQNEIAGQISNLVSKQLTGTEPLRENLARSTNLDAYLKFLDAQALVRRLTIDDAEQAAVILEQVTKMDPGFALAYAEQARALFIARALGLAKFDRAAIMPLVEKALSLDPMLGEAYIMRGILQNGDHKTEEADFRKGIALAPNYAPGYELYSAALHDDFDRPKEAMAMIERAIRIDPLAAEYLVQKVNYVLSDKHQDALAEQLYVQALQLEPDFAEANLALANIKWGKGETAEGIKLIERAMRGQTKGNVIRDLACAMYLDIGDRQAAQSLVAELPAESAANIMLAAYDHNFQKAAAHEVDWDTTTAVAELSYWISLDAAARQSGTIAKTLARLRKEFPLKNVTNGTAPAGEYDAALTITADLLRAQGDRAAVNQMLPPLKELLDKNEGRSGWAHSYLKLLAGDPDGALALLAMDMHRQHFSNWWMLDRDPFWVDQRDDPRFRGILEFARGQAAQQREILERMRRLGDVPLRSSDNHARVAAGTARSSGGV
jgi:transcriptional activator of cad operon